MNASRIPIPAFRPQPTGKRPLPMIRPQNTGSYGGIMGYHPVQMAPFGSGGNNHGMFPGLGGYGKGFK